MKILIVCQYYYPEPFSITDVAEELVKRGHQVSVLTAKPNYGYGKIIPGYEKLNFEILNGVKVHRINVIARKDSKFSIAMNYLSFYFHALCYVNKLHEDYDVVYSMSLSPVISIAPAIKWAKKHHKKHVLHCLDLWPESVTVTGMIKENSIFYKILYKWSRSLYSKVDEILVSSPSFIKYFSSILKLNTDNISYVPQPTLDIDPADPIEYDSDFLNLLYCGNIGRLQEVELLVKALGKLNNKKIRLYLIGQGTKTQSVLDSVKELHISKNIIYLGSKPREVAARYFVNADAFYVGLKNEGSVGETIPNKIATYMKYGKPIVAVIDGDGKELLKMTQGEKLISSPNVEDLASKIDCLFNMTQEEKEEMGRSNKEFFLKTRAQKRLLIK